MGEGTFPLGMADRAMRLTEREQDAAAGQVRVRSVRHRENCDLTRQVFSCCPPFFSCREIGISGREMAVCRPESTHRTGQQSTAQYNESQFERNEQFQLVHRLVNELPEKQRTIVQLRDIEGKSYKEIADVLGITEEQVKVNLFRARQRIKLKYSEINDYGL